MVPGGFTVVHDTVKPLLNAATGICTVICILLCSVALVE